MKREVVHSQGKRASRVTEVQAQAAGMRRTQTSVYALLAAGVTVLLWASAFPGIRAGLRSYSPAHVALVRYAVASITLGVYAVATRLPLPRWRDVPGVALTGVIGITVYNVALNSGEVGVPAATASFIVAAAPVFMAIESRLFLGERLRRLGWLGILMSLAGVLAIALGTGGGLGFDAPALLILAAAIAQSVYFVAQKPYLRRYTPAQYTTYAIWAGTLVLLLFSPGLLAEAQKAPVDVSLAVVYLGVFPGAIGYVIWAYALSRMPASTTGSFLYLVPVCALGISWIWLGELASALSIAGGVVVLVGVIVVSRYGKAQRPADVVSIREPQGATST
jgi:drug/metabolite transporter (DMT)-like permease